MVSGSSLPRNAIARWNHADHAHCLLLLETLPMTDPVSLAVTALVQALRAELAKGRG